MASDTTPVSDDTVRSFLGGPAVSTVLAAVFVLGFELRGAIGAGESVDFRLVAVALCGTAASVLAFARYRRED